MRTSPLSKRSLKVVALLFAAALGSRGQESSPAAETGAGQTLVLARQLYARQQYAQALPLFLKAAEGADGEAALYVGVMYDHGQGGLTKDDAQAAGWYRKAADAGNANGMSNLGSMYALGRGGWGQSARHAAAGNYVRKRAGWFA
jgi:hypothetical protein